MIVRMRQTIVSSKKIKMAKMKRTAKRTSLSIDIFTNQTNRPILGFTNPFNCFFSIVNIFLIFCK